MDISLGPLLFHWGKDNFYKFYEEMAETDVAVVYLGEVVCADRKGVELEDMAAVAKMLADKGKQVYLSTLGLMATAKEVQMTRDLCALPFDIEANNPGVFSIVTPEAGKKVAAGPHLTLYNTPSVKFMERIGAERVTFLVELPGSAIATMSRQTSMKTEVFAYGRLPLAFSWRCYTSRNFGKLRSQCTQDCMNFSDGIALETLDHKPIFTINGTQIMSNQVYSLAEEVEDLRRMGMSTLRLSPHSWQMKDVIAIHAALVNGTMTGRSARAELEKITGAPLCNGWFYGRAGWERVDRDAPDALKILGIENVSVS